MKVLVTGAKGFVGKNLTLALKERGDEVFAYDKESSLEDLDYFLSQADGVVHLAGTNRSSDAGDFVKGNIDLTQVLLDRMGASKRPLPVLFSSSIHAGLDTPYGQSKRQAEALVMDYGKKNQVPVYVCRFANMYGKWCRPFYNSVIATWCTQVAHGQEIRIDDRDKEIDFIYIDDVVAFILRALDGKLDQEAIYYPTPQDRRSLGEVADRLFSFKESRKNFSLPQIDSQFDKNLYSTYLTYLELDDFSYPLIVHQDDRGLFSEILKRPGFGQVSVNVSKPHITKGNHYHHTKVEKFCVVYGRAKLVFRSVWDDHVFSYEVSDQKLEVVDIPPGYTHSIVNIGDTDLVTLIWANEPYDPTRPDTIYEEV